MIIYSESDPVRYDNGARTVIKTIFELDGVRVSKTAQEAIATCMNHGMRITIRELYKKFFGLDIDDLLGSISIDYTVDPDEWGWDSNGNYRRLYEIKRIEL